MGIALTTLHVHHNSKMVRIAFLGAYYFHPSTQNEEELGPGVCPREQGTHLFLIYRSDWIRTSDLRSAVTHDQRDYTPAPPLRPCWEVGVVYGLNSVEKGLIRKVTG
jgi:hypothetical protein